MRVSSSSTMRRAWMQSSGTRRLGHGEHLPGLRRRAVRQLPANVHDLPLQTSTGSRAPAAVANAAAWRRLLAACELSDASANSPRMMIGNTRTGPRRARRSRTGSSVRSVSRGPPARASRTMSRGCVDAITHLRSQGRQCESAPLCRRNSRPTRYRIR